jgi:hypothetical protein
MKMSYRRLGSSGPETSALGLGCMGMSDLYGPSSRQESIATIHDALDAGITLLDTGDFYGNGGRDCRSDQGRLRCPCSAPVARAAAITHRRRPARSRRRRPLCARSARASGQREERFADMRDCTIRLRLQQSHGACSYQSASGNRTCVTESA